MVIAYHLIWGGPGWKVFLDSPDDIRRTIPYVQRATSTESAATAPPWGALPEDRSSANATEDHRRQNRHNLAVPIIQRCGNRKHGRRFNNHERGRCGNDSRSNGNDSRRNGNDSRSSKNDSRRNGNDSRSSENDSRRNGNDSRSSKNGSRRNGDDSRRSENGSRCAKIGSAPKTGGRTPPRGRRKRQPNRRPESPFHFPIDSLSGRSSL